MSIQVPQPYEDYWNDLQQPAHPSNQLKQQHRALLAALDQGWQVAEPVYLRPRWTEQGPWVYHFILTSSRYNLSTLLTVPVSMETETLVRGEGWQIEAANKSGF